jgi:hypothetical protein
LYSLIIDFIMRTYVLLAIAGSSHAFIQGSALVSRSVTSLNGATGGWGIGNSREMVPEEFARGDRSAFEGYKLRDKGEFMRQVRQDKENMQKSELEELLNVAKIAGIEVKDPSERLNKFDDDLFDDDDLDLSVPLDEEIKASKATSVADNSITRLDEDTGALGVW